MTRAMRDGLVEELALGAPEAVLDLCGNQDNRTCWEATIEATANAGRRLLLLAGRVGNATWRPRAIFAFTDTLRVGIPEALRTATEAGIRTVVVTGDHPTTAATARAAGLPGERMCNRVSNWTRWMTTRSKDRWPVST